jgi:alpha-tubulin suppressor-like RCC1 family protein
VSSSKPICSHLPDNEKAVAVASGEEFTAALTKAGHVYTWGYPEHRGYGVALGLGEGRSPVRTPTLVGFPVDVKVDAIAAGSYHVLALTDEGEIYAWGSNEYGQLCMPNNIVIDSDLPTKHPGLDTTIDPNAIGGGGGSIEQDVDGDAHGSAGGEATSEHAGETNDTRFGGGGDTVSDSEGIVTFGGEGADDNNDANGIEWDEDGRPKLVTEVPDGVTFTSVAAGEGHSLALGSDERVYACGANGNGQLGVPPGEGGYKRSNLSAVDALGDVAVAEIAAGGYTSAAVVDGKVYRWGSDPADGASDPYTSDTRPAHVEGLSSTVGVSVSRGAMAAWTSQGDLYTWGDDYDDLLGNAENKGDKSEPTLVPSLRVAGVSMGSEHVVAVGRDGRIYTWGNAADGKLGGDSTDSGVGAQLINELEDKDIAEISAGMNFALARSNTGKLYGWGHNENSQLGVNGASRIPIPREIKLEGREVTHIAAGNDHSLAVTDNKQVWAWGANQSWQLGYEYREGTSGVAEPVRVTLDTPPSGISKIAAGSQNSLALLDNGTVWVWGANASAELGITGDLHGVDSWEAFEAATPDTVLPQPMPEVCTGKDTEGIPVYAVLGGNTFTALLVEHSSTEAPENASQLASQSDGMPVRDQVTLTMCGIGSWYNQVGIPVGDVWGGELGILLGDFELLAAAAGQDHLLFVVSRGDGVMAFGRAGDNELGCAPEDEGSAQEPTPVDGDVEFGCFSMAGEEGDAESAGEGMGDGAAESMMLVPPELEGEKVSVDASATDDLVEVTQVEAIEVNNADENQEQDGDETQSETNVGRLLGSVSVGLIFSVGSPVKAVAAGNNFSMALLENGDVFTWGSNDLGQLGRATDGTSTSVPGKVVGLLEDENIVQIDAGDSFALALAEDGSVYTWGSHDTPSAPTARVDLVFWEPFEEPGSDNPGGSGNGQGDLGDLCDPCYPDGRPGPGGSTGPDGSSGSSGQGGGSGVGVGDGIGGENGDDGQLGVSGTGTHGLQPPGDGGVVAQNPPGAARAAIARFGTRFKTVVIPVGTTAKVRVAAYGTTTPASNKAKVTWKMGNKKVASVVKNAKSGTKTWKVGAANTLKVKGFKAGRTVLKLTSPGARTVVIQVKVVAKKATASVRRIKLTAPRPALKPGQSMTLRPRLTPLGAVRAFGTWTSTNRAVATVDPVGRVTAKSKGRTTIVLKVGTTRTKLTVQVK